MLVSITEDAAEPRVICSGRSKTEYFLGQKSAATAGLAGSGGGGAVNTDHAFTIKVAKEEE